MTPEQKALAFHRFERAETSLQEAKDELIRKNPRLAVNRAYYTSIQSLMDLRHEGDYQDFAVITAEEANGAVETAQSALDTMRNILKKLVEVI